MTQDMIALGFDRIIGQLKNHAVSLPAQRLLSETAPILNEGLCAARMQETTAARRVLDSEGAPPLAQTEETEESLKDFTAWDRERLGLHSGGEFFYIRKNGELLYAVITNADSILTAAHELMELIANKF